MNKIEEAVRNCGNLYGSDVHVRVGSCICYRERGELTRALDTPVTESDFAEFVQKYDLGIPKDHALDESRSISGIMCRLSLFNTREGIGAAIRLLNNEIPELSTLNLPSQVNSFLNLKQGLMLVTGTVGSGKTTTLAAILNEYNLHTSGVILTLEDPVEYKHKDINCLVHQREIGKDVVSFKEGVENALRQDINVALVGEMRDRDTIDAVLTMAETGHLIMGTVHTNSTAGAIERIAGVFPPEARTTVISRMLNVFVGGIHMRLVKGTDGVRHPFCHVLHMNTQLRQGVEKGQYSQIAESMRSDPLCYSDIECATDLYRNKGVPLEALTPFLSDDMAKILNTTLGLSSHVSI